MTEARDHAELTILRAMVEELQEENRQLREALTPTVRLNEDWGLSPQETALLLTLYGSTGVVRFEALAVALSRGTDPLTDEHIAVLASKVRRKLTAHRVAIRITNRWGVGYCLDDASRAVISDAINGLNTTRKAA